MAKRKRRRYTDEERAELCVLLESEGYPEKLGSLARVAQISDVPESTLRSWFKARRNPPPAELRDKKRTDLKQLLQDILQDYGIHLLDDDVKGEASARDAAQVFGIMFDKLRLLEDKSTENLEIVDKAAARERLAHLITRRNAAESDSGDSEYTH